MKIKVRSFFTLLLLLLMISSNSVFANSETKRNEENIQKAKIITNFEEDISSVIIEYVNAINEKDWETFVEVQSLDRQEWYVDFPS